MPKRTYIRNGGQWVDITVGASIPLLNAPPSSPVTGQIYFDTTTDSVRVYDGTSWQNAVEVSDSTSTTSSSIAASSTAVKNAYELAGNAIPKNILTSAGDIIYATSGSTPQRLGVGSENSVLRVISGAPSWQTLNNANVYYQATQPTGGTYSPGDIWIDSDDNTTLNTNNLLISQKVASYTLASDLSDAPDELIEMNVASANTLSIPTDATANYPIGTQVHVFQFGAGQTTIQAVTPGTTTVVGTPGLKLRAQYSFATLIKRAANYWIVVGDTAP